MAEVARHKKGSTIQHVTRNGRVFLHCKDLFSMLGLNWNAKKVLKLSTVKVKVKTVKVLALESLNLAKVKVEARASPFPTASMTTAAGVKSIKRLRLWLKNA